MANSSFHDVTAEIRDFLHDLVSRFEAAVPPFAPLLDRIEQFFDQVVSSFNSAPSNSGSALLSASSAFNPSDQVGQSTTQSLAENISIPSEADVDRSSATSNIGVDALVTRGGDPLPAANPHTVTGTDRSDLFVFHPGDVDGATITDFSAGDALVFSGFGEWALFNQIGHTNEWVIYSPLDNHEEVLTAANNYTFHPGDYFFV